MGDVQFLCVRPHIWDELSEVLRRKVLSRYDHDRCRNDQADWLKVNIRFVRKVWVGSDRGDVRPIIAHDDCVAIWTCTHCTDRASRATGSNYILNDDLLAERARHVIGDDTCTYVASSACGKWDDYSNWARRIGLRPRGA
jgi:hypothetical protein